MDVRRAVRAVRVPVPRRVLGAAPLTAVVVVQVVQVARAHALQAAQVNVAVGVLVAVLRAVQDVLVVQALVDNGVNYAY